jgi:hypothetical protein
VRTCVYIDGFNLYYRALRGTPHRWLDLAAMARAALPAGLTVEKIKYYTAHVSGRTDPDAPRRQHAYLRAIATIPEVEIFFGNFMVTKKWAGLVQPPDFRPITLTAAAPTEEKGSDVNLGVHLVRDGFLKTYEAAAIVTNDTDLEEPIRVVAQELKLHTVLLAPTGKPSASLSKLVHSVRHIQPYLGPCQLPPRIVAPNGKLIIKPAGW